MMRNHKSILAIALASTLPFQFTFADCTIAEASRALDPVEVGFCESDAVFIGTIDSRIETVRAFRPEGSEITTHLRTETSTISISKSYKGKLPGKVTMIADLYDKKSPAYSFQRGKEYLVFAKQLPGEDRYAGASAMCSVQPTLLIADAQKAVEQLEENRKGRKAIDCKSVRAKEKP